MDMYTGTRWHSSTASCEILLELVDHLDAMLAYWDRDQVCVFVNEAYRSWFGKTREQIIGTTLRDLLGPELYGRNEPYIRAAYAGQVQVFERDIPHPDGRIRHSLATYTPRIVNGVVQGIFVHVADVGPLKTLERELRAAYAEAARTATHDFLTGLPNRVLLGDRLAQTLALSRRTQRMVAVLSLDLDGFKQVNDEFGHHAGDQFLVDIASRLAHSLRETDSVIRMGGDEFLVLCPAIDSATEAESMAARILERIRAPLVVKGTTVRPSCSIGIALAPPETVTPEELITNSDRALYLAKRRGRDQYAFADPG